MTIYWLQQVWFGEVYNQTNEIQKQYLSVSLPTVNIYANIGLTIFSPGFDLPNKVAGLAAAGVKSYSYIDANGATQKVNLDNWQSHLYIERCTTITFVFTVQRAWAKAEGIIYWYTN